MRAMLTWTSQLEDSNTTYLPSDENTRPEFSQIRDGIQDLDSFAEEGQRWKREVIGHIHRWSRRRLHSLRTADCHQRTGTSRHSVF